MHQERASELEGEMNEGRQQRPDWLAVFASGTLFRSVSCVIRTIGTIRRIRTHCLLGRIPVDEEERSTPTIRTVSHCSACEHWAWRWLWSRFPSLLGPRLKMLLVISPASSRCLAGSACFPCRLPESLVLSSPLSLLSLSPPIPCSVLKAPSIFPSPRSFPFEYSFIHSFIACCLPGCSLSFFLLALRESYQPGSHSHSPIPQTALPPREKFGLLYLDGRTIISSRCLGFLVSV